MSGAGVIHIAAPFATGLHQVDNPVFDANGNLYVTYSGTRIELPDVLAVLGVADEQLLADAFDAVQQGDARGALLTVARCAEGGRDAGSRPSPDRRELRRQKRRL